MKINNNTKTLLITYTLIKLYIIFRARFSVWCSLHFTNNLSRHKGEKIVISQAIIILIKMRSRRIEQIMGCLFAASMYVIFTSVPCVDANPLHEEHSDYRVHRATNVFGSPANTAG